MKEGRQAAAMQTRERQVAARGCGAAATVAPRRGQRTRALPSWGPHSFTPLMDITSGTGNGERGGVQARAVTAVE